MTVLRAAEDHDGGEEEHHNQDQQEVQHGDQQQQQVEAEVQEPPPPEEPEDNVDDAVAPVVQNPPPQDNEEDKRLDEEVSAAAAAAAAANSGSNRGSRRHVSPPRAAVDRDDEVGSFSEDLSGLAARLRGGMEAALRRRERHFNQARGNQDGPAHPPRPASPVERTGVKSLRQLHRIPALTSTIWFALEVHEHHLVRSETLPALLYMRSVQVMLHLWALIAVVKDAALGMSATVARVTGIASLNPLWYADRGFTLVFRMADRLLAKILEHVLDHYAPKLVLAEVAEINEAVMGKVVQVVERARQYRILRVSMWITEMLWAVVCGAFFAVREQSRRV